MVWFLHFIPTAAVVLYRFQRSTNLANPTEEISEQAQAQNTMMQPYPSCTKESVLAELWQMRKAMASLGEAAFSELTTLPSNDVLPSELVTRYHLLMTLSFHLGCADAAFAQEDVQRAGKRNLAEVSRELQLPPPL